MTALDIPISRLGMRNPQEEKTSAFRDKNSSESDMTVVFLSCNNEKGKLMRHDMNLNPEPFELIRKGRKTVELRLNDKKRQKIREKDLIYFHRTDEEYDVLKCRARKIRTFPDFHELYLHYDPASMGYLEGEKADSRDMYEYYSMESISRYGAMAIEIEYLDDLYLVDGHMHLEYGELNEEYVMRFVDAAVARGLDEINILDHTHRFKEFECCYEHLRKYKEQDTWLKQKTKFCNTLDDYYNLIETIRKKDLPIRVKFGLEVCYSANTEDMLRQVLKNVHLDFLTGAVHSIDSILYDMPFSMKLFEDRKDLETIDREFYESELSLVHSGLFNRLAHPDQIRICGSYDDAKLFSTYEKLANALKEADMYAENNSGIHYRYGFDVIGLGENLLRTFRNRRVRLICASDAHKPEHVGTNIYEATMRNRGDID